MNMPAVTSTPDYKLAKIPLNHLRPFHHQLRKHFDPDALYQLSESIRAQGVVQPIIIRTAPPGPDGTRTIEPWEIIAGERRWRAAGMAELTEIPAVIRDDLSDADVEVLHLIENLQRQDLDLVETCDGAAKLVALVGFEKACEQAGQTETWMSQHSRLGELDAAVQNLVRKGWVGSMETAHSIEKLKVYNPKEFQQTVSEFDQSNKYSRAPSRENLRRRVRDAKQAYDERKKKAEDKKKEQAALRERLKKNPKLKEKLEAEKAKSPEAQRKAREEQCKKLNAEGDQIERELTEKLLQLTGFKLTQQKTGYSRRDLPVRVTQWDQFYAYGGTTLPASAETAQFQVRFEGTLDVIAPALNKVAPGAKVSLQMHQLKDITQEEARKIEKTLGRSLQWDYHAQTTPKKLRGQLENAAPGVKKAEAPLAAKPGTNTSVPDFIAAGVTKKAGSKVKAADLHAKYAAWCKANGRQAEILPLNGGANEFGAAIAKAKIERKREKTGYVYLGIEFKA